MRNREAKTIAMRMACLSEAWETAAMRGPDTETPTSP